MKKQDIEQVGKSRSFIKYVIWGICALLVSALIFAAVLIYNIIQFSDDVRGTYRSIVEAMEPEPFDPSKTLEACIAAGGYDSYELYLTTRYYCFLPNGDRFKIHEPLDVGLPTPKQKTK